MMNNGSRRNIGSKSSMRTKSRIDEQLRVLDDHCVQILALERPMLLQFEDLGLEGVGLSHLVSHSNMSNIIEINRADDLKGEVAQMCANAFVN